MGQLMHLVAQNKRLSWALAVCLLCAAFANYGTVCKADSAPGAKSSIQNVDDKAPDFTLADINGVPHTLSSMHGQTVALYFFCGCKWCVNCATIWGQMQRAGALSVGDQAHPIQTWVVFAGGKDEASEFEKKCNLDQSQTVMLPSPGMHEAIDLYHADICPRVFVISPNGSIAYTNNHKSDQPRQAPENVITRNALHVIRAQPTSIAQH
jgi:peroxiredoxin